MNSHPRAASVPGRRWLESEVLLLVVLVGVGYFFRLGDLTPRGEESRRALVALEMVRTGDWLVPRQQGEPYFSRPPLQNWLIAAVAQVRGDCDIWAARLPSVLATLLTALLIYGYSRTFLVRTGAFTGAAAFLTMPLVLQLGGLAETDALFTFFVAGSLLVWHWGWSRAVARPSQTKGVLSEPAAPARDTPLLALRAQGVPCFWNWTLAYALVALGTLTKGPQAPVYFLLSVGVFLLLSGQLRQLWSFGHLFGLSIFVVGFGLWLTPFTQELGLDAAARILGNQAALRFAYTDFWRLGLQLLTYPLSILACMLPWSLCLLAFLNRSFRATLGEALPNVRFLVVCLLVTFPSCWFAQGAQPRWWLSLFPCVAPLIGLVIQRTVESAADSSLRRWWTWYVTGCALVLACVPVLALTGDALESRFGWPLTPPPLFVAVGLTLTLAFYLLLALLLRRNFQPAKFQLAAFALAGCLALAYSGWFVTVLSQRSIDTAGAVAELKQQLAGAPLVSFDEVHHLFPYIYRDPIARLNWPHSEADVPADLTYFCFNADTNARQPFAAPEPLPFAWEPVAIINCDRSVRPKINAAVVIGKRLPGQSIHAGAK